MVLPSALIINSLNLQFIVFKKQLARVYFCVFKSMRHCFVLEFVDRFDLKLKSTEAAFLCLCWLLNSSGIWKTAGFWRGLLVSLVS